MKGLYGTLFLLSIILLIMWVVIRIMASVSFGMDCTDYLKRAADSNSIELASKNLNIAIDYLEKHELTNGTVSVFLKQPKNDVGFFYQNLVAAKNDLVSINEDTIPLERINVLMNLRETLLDNGDKVTLPHGISIYPNNLSYFYWALFSFISAIVFGICFAFSRDNFY